MQWHLAKRLTWAILITTGLASCEYLDTNLREKIPLDSVTAIEPPPEEPEGEIPLSQEEAQPGLEKTEIYPGTKQFMRPVPTPHPKKEAGQYTLNFDDADLGEVAKVILGDILQVNYTMSPKAGGKITLQTTRPLRKDEVIPALEMALRMNGLALTLKNGFYWIGPANEATVGAPIGLVQQKLPPGFQIRIFPLRYVSVESMEKVLKPILPPNAILYTDNIRNLMVVAGSESELAPLEDTIGAFDVNYLEGMSVGLFPLDNVDVDTLAQDLKNVLGDKIFGEESSLLRVFPIKRLNALMAISSQPDYLEMAETWIERLDRTTSETSGGVHVYRVQNVDAVELADTLNQIFTGRSSKPPEASLAPGLKKETVSGTTSGSSSSSSNNRPRASTSGSAVSTKGEVRIIADESNNALIVIADQEDYRAIERVINRLDIMPLQVFIDASIIEVTLEDQLQYGLQWFVQNKLPKTNSSIGLTENGINLTDAAKEALLSTFSSGFSYTFLNSSRDIGVILQALASDNKLNVISAPSLMVLNNHEANIVVGDQISLRTGSFVNTASSSGVAETFQQRDTGVQLTIKPRVNAGGLVIMELEQTVDDVGAQQDNSGNPTILKREIKSTVAVKDGDTLVLGGLIRDRRSQDEQGIPFLHSLPLIGPLFGSTNERFNRTELVVLLTPRVVQSRGDVYGITNEFKQRLRQIYEVPGDYFEKQIPTKQPGDHRQHESAATKESHAMGG
ncbi:MAG: type II secretion system secretin GspD [Methylohalobius sp. ZOD2]